MPTIVSAIKAACAAMIEIGTTPAKMNVGYSGRWDEQLEVGIVVRWRTRRMAAKVYFPGAI